MSGLASSSSLLSALLPLQYQSCFYVASGIGDGPDNVVSAKLSCLVYNLLSQILDKLIMPSAKTSNNMLIYTFLLTSHGFDQLASQSLIIHRQSHMERSSHLFSLVGCSFSSAFWIWMQEGRWSCSKCQENLLLPRLI